MGRSIKKGPFVDDKLLKKVDPTLCRSALAGIVGASRGVRWHAVSQESAREFAKRYPRHAWGKCQWGTLRKEKNQP